MGVFVEFKFTDESIHNLFGAEAAESDDLTRLRQYYFKSDIYESVMAKLPLRIIVGHKGIGKSALITVAFQEDLESDSIPLLIQPSDITSMRADEKDFNQLIQQWKVGISEIIIHKAFGLLGVPDEESHIGKFKAMQIKLMSFLTDTVGRYDGKKELSNTQQELVERLIANKSINVYLDDLDRGWEGSKNDIKKMSALLNAARDIAKENPTVRFKIALRSDVYFLVRTSDESTDKIESSVVWYSWTNHEILAMFAKRVETFFGREVKEADLVKKSQPELAKSLGKVMDLEFFGRGIWERIPTYRMLMTLVRKRPRDLVKLCTLAAKQAQKRKAGKIQSQDFQAIFEEYSQGRIQDTINEYKTELPDLERLLFGMKPSRQEKSTRSGYVYSTDSLLKKIQTITTQGKFNFQNGKVASEKGLAGFLYKINFLTARKELKRGLILRKYFEENRYISGVAGDFGFEWEVHPAYRWALQPDDIQSILINLQPSADEGDADLKEK